jgi:hypothetical protein
MEITEERILETTANTGPYLVRNLYGLHYGSAGIGRLQEHDRNYGPFRQGSSSGWTRRPRSRDSCKMVYSTILSTSLLTLRYCFRQRSIVHGCPMDSYMPDLTDQKETLNSIFTRDRWIDRTYEPSSRSFPSRVRKPRPR